MLYFRKPGNITITCHNRIAPYLAQEVKALGFAIEEEFVTGVKIKGSLNDCIRLNLNLRCASQVLYSLRKFSARNADEIYNEARKMQWESILPINAYLTITSSVNNETINNSMFANVRVKDAIVDRLRYKTGRRPDTGSDPEASVIHLFWKEEEAEIFVDTSGHSLGRHGYRKYPGQAPMLEALAAATIYATGWDRVSPFINPMCGSGTLAIEAAMIATNRVPGLFRDNYGFKHILGFEEAIFEEEKMRIQKQIKHPDNLQIIASDHSRDAIKNARLNAAAADVLEYITLDQCDFEVSTVPETNNGILMMNPEYGLRLGEIEELEVTYARIGNFMKQKCGGYTGFIFTGNPDLGKKIGLKPKRKIEFYNSKLDCRLLKYELYEGTKRRIKTEDED
ncbi:THUMP domain-containing class I SAM-dependent RNA methyltransferase [Rhizosphaericola mali]|uniref:Class I SAM-dependent RNA methyltransferase n=1 Tax=Rhizosphaericola mali TaxID=2545455 RepID=A0A5P2G6Z7_9BACT|nr:class I SAM-dependent RNA methyltransferase [Rhizosphaericola mali]QES89712.1 class I SAM-dependent RNA methyltransferase [Rhizosphaericola mali]